MAAPRKFIFKSVKSGESAVHDNMKQIVDNVSTNSFLPGTTGFTGVATTEAYYQTFGPLVHFAVTHIGTDIQWTVAVAVVKLPFLPSKCNRHNAAIAYGNAGVQLDNFVRAGAVSDTTLIARAGYAVAGQTAVTIQGWYFRD